MSPAASPTLGMVLKGYPRISESFISNEILLLERQGFKIHIFSMRHPREEFSHASVKAIQAAVTYLPSELEPNLHRFLPAVGRAMLSRPLGFARTLPLLRRRLAESKQKSATWKHFCQACYLLAHGGLEVGHLHAHFAHSPTSVTMFAASLLGVPFSFTAHAKDIYTQRPQSLAVKLNAARFVVTCTDYNRRHLMEIAPEKSVHCIYHGIDLSLFSAQGKPIQAQPPYRIMTVARLVKKKGLPTVLEALALLRRRGLDFRYVLVGEGEDRPEVEALLRDLGLDGVTTMTGTLPHEKVLEHYRAADLFTLGCRVADNGDRDGIPNVLAEAMAMGVPVAATDVSALGELVLDGKCGLLAPPEDPEALATAMERLLTDQELRARVIPAALGRVREVFDNQALSVRLAQVYRSHGVDG